MKVKKKKPGAAFPVAASPTLKADATDPVSGRRQFRLLVLAVESKIRQLAKLLPEVDFDAIARAIDNEFFPESEQEDSAKQEAKNDLHNIVIALRDTGIIIAQMLRDLEVRRQLDVDPIVEASTQWPVVYSKYPALNQKSINPLKERLGSAIKNKSRGTSIWPSLVSMIIDDIKKHLPDTEQFRKARLPWLLDFTDDKGRRFELAPDAFEVLEKGNKADPVCRS